MRAYVIFKDYTKINVFTTAWSEQEGFGFFREWVCFSTVGSPDVFHQIGIINKGIAIALYIVNGFNAISLFGAHRILPVPFQ
jgi:hypothetical protein